MNGCILSWSWNTSRPNPGTVLLENQKKKYRKPGNSSLIIHFNNPQRTGEHNTDGGDIFGQMLAAFENIRVAAFDSNALKLFF